MKNANLLSLFMGYVLLTLVISCASPPPPLQLPQTIAKTAGADESIITIERTSAWTALIADIYIDSVAQIAIGPGSTGRMVVPNGAHLIETKIHLVSSGDEKQYASSNVVLAIEVNSESVTYSLDVKYLSKSVLTETNRVTLENASTGLEGALTRAATEVLKNVPKGTRIAIVYITAQDKNTAEYIVGELEYILVNESYYVTDRSQLDILRQEQKFGMSGEVDDATAARIGHLSGANIIITGRVDGEGNLQRLRLRALDTETAQVLGVASERL